MSDDRLTVVTDNNVTIQVFKMAFSLNKEQTCFVYQFPIAYAWGMTIHRVQGQSLDYMSVDLANLFACYQAYVGLSRAKTLKRLFITNYQHNMALVDPAVERFYKKYENDNDVEDYEDVAVDKKRKRKSTTNDMDLIKVLDYDDIFEKCRVTRALKHKLVRNENNTTALHLQPHDYEFNLHSLYWTNNTRDLIFFLAQEDVALLHLEKILEKNKQDDEKDNWIINFIDQVVQDDDEIPLVQSLVIKCSGPIIINKKPVYNGVLKIDMAHYSYLMLTGACLVSYMEIILNSSYCKSCEFFSINI